MAKKAAFFRATEVIANVAIIVVAAALIVMLARREFGGREARPHGSGPSIGTLVSLPGVDWKPSPRTLLLVLDPRCHYCTESAPLYRRIVATHGATRIVAVLSSPVEASRQYLAELGVPVSEVHQASPGHIGVEGTPTLVLVDRDGNVVRVWRGKLTTETERDVLAEVAFQGQSGTALPEGAALNSVP